jgi:hypothetical protein
MAIAPVWLLLGLCYWAAILFGGLLVFTTAPKGRRVRREAAYCATATLTIASTALVPVIGIWVWMPVVIFAMIPIHAIKELVVG